MLLLQQQKLGADLQAACMATQPLTIFAARRSLHRHLVDSTMTQSST